jgi:RNA polymerase sigma-70 factor, ECF subfamily
MNEWSLNWNQVQNELKGFVFKRVRDKAAAEDIVHDVFLKVQSKIQQVRETKKLFGWIYQITRNAIIDHYRKNKKQISLDDIDWQSNPQNFNDCVANVINELLPTLPDKYRVPLEMSELQDMSQLEVAERLGLSYPAAKSRIQRARRLLKDKLDEILIIKTDGYGNVLVCMDKGLCR